MAFKNNRRRFPSEASSARGHLRIAFTAYETNARCAPTQNRTPLAHLPCHRTEGTKSFLD